MSQEQDFQLIVCKEDYDQLKKWENKHNDLQKLYNSLRKDNQGLKKQLNYYKKLLFQRKQQVTFILDKFTHLFDALNGKTGLKELEISQSYYQQLVDLQAEGVSKIQMQALKQQLEFQHASLTKKIKSSEKIFSDLNKKIDQLNTVILQKNNEQQSKKPLNQKKSLDQEIIVDIVKENKQLKLKISEKEKQIQYLMESKVKFSQEKQQLVEKLRKYQQIEKNKVMGEKSNRIKLLIDQYHQELQKNLIQIGGLQQTEIQELACNELNGIVEYIKNLISKKIKRKAK